MPKYYSPARTNKNTGSKTHGSFKNSGQKAGKQGANKAKPASESVVNHNADAQVQKLVNKMYGQKKSNKVPAKRHIMGMGRE